MIIKLLLLFTIFSILGWFGEIFYRNITTKEKNYNPGFLKGPYLPIYGFAAIIVYFISLIQIHLVLLTLLSAVALTLLELFTGLILKKLKIDLWDYSNKKFNYKGIICLEISIIWIVLSAITINWGAPIFQSITLIPKEVIWLLGFFYIVIFVDMIIVLKKLILKFNK